MARIEFREPNRSVILSRAEALLILAAEFGVELLDAFFPKKYPHTRLTRKLIGLDAFNGSGFRVTRHRLVRRGLLEKRSHSYHLTARGHNEVEKLKRLLHGPKTIWDGQWRFVIFDIPEKLKAYRDSLRRRLADNDFRRLQDSVWVGKHPIPEDVHEFIQAGGLQKYICMFVISAIDRDGVLESVFNQ